MNFSLFFIWGFIRVIKSLARKTLKRFGKTKKKNNIEISRQKYKNKLCSKVNFVNRLFGPFLWQVLFFLLPKDLLLAFSS